MSESTRAPEEREQPEIASLCLSPSVSHHTGGMPLCFPWSVRTWRTTIIQDGLQSEAGFPQLFFSETCREFNSEFETSKSKKVDLLRGLWTSHSVSTPQSILGNMLFQMNVQHDHWPQLGFSSSPCPSDYGPHLAQATPPFCFYLFMCCLRFTVYHCWENQGRFLVKQFTECLTINSKKCQLLFLSFLFFCSRYWQSKRAPSQEGV